MANLKNAILTELNYSEWATRELLAAASHLTREELLRDLGLSHRSVLETLHHIFLSERFWMECLRANALPPLSEIGTALPPPVPPLEELASDWASVWDGFRQWIAALDDEALGHELVCWLADGKEFCVSLWKVVLHSVNHSTQHRGQIVSMFRLLGHPIRQNTDIFSFYLK